jgi:uncharacterized protein YjbI with pentapeptide repeats
VAGLGFFYEDAKLTGNQKFTKLHNVIFSDAKEFEHVDFSTAKLTGQVNFSGTRLQRFTNEEIVKPDFSLEQTKDANGVSKSMGGLSIF